MIHWFREADPVFGRIIASMPARESELKPAEEVAPPEVAPAEPEAAKTEFSAEGELPAVAAPVAAPAAATASTQAFGNKEEEAAKLDKGMHVNWEDYKATAERTGKPEKWKDHYKIGHTSANGWVQPHERYKVYLEWQLQKGASASKAVQEFIKGPTICDYRTAGVAAEMNEVRAELGDKKFDKLFGSANTNEDAAIPTAQRLVISPGLYTTPLGDNMRAIARAADEREKSAAEEPKAAPVQEARVEEKPKAEAELEQEPLVVAQELGLQQADREMV
jgi:hypothetical protein